MPSVRNARPARVLDFPRYEISTEDACWLEEDFQALLASAQNHHPQPSLIQTPGEMFPVLIPANIRHLPLWVVRLPEEHTMELAHFGKSMPKPLNHSSVDLLHNKTFLTWPGKSCHLLFEANDVNSTLNGAACMGRLVVLFVTPSRLMLTTYRISDDYMMNLSMYGMCTGSNYSPYRVFSDDVLDAARVRALDTPHAWQFDPDEEGRPPVLLPVFTARGKEE